MAEIQQFNLGQLLGQAEAIKGARRQNQLGELLQPLQLEEARLSLANARSDRTARLAGGAIALMGSDWTNPEAWARGVTWAEQQGADVTPFKDGPSVEKYKLIQQLAGSQQGKSIQSTYIDDQGQRVAIYRDGTTSVLGKAGTNKQIIDGLLVDPLTGQASAIGGGGGTLTPDEIREQQEAEARRKADEAAGIKSAEQRAALEVRTQLEPGLKSAVTAAEAAAKQAAELSAEQRSNTRAFSTYETGMKNLSSALGATTTGPVAGWLPAITSNAQVAEGAAAVMAPILKSLFREAGEGTFTEGDQKLLMDMLPSRTDHPDAAKAKMKFIDDLVRQKLSAGPAQTTTPSTSGTGAQSGGVKFLGFE